MKKRRQGTRASSAKTAKKVTVIAKGRKASDVEQAEMSREISMLRGLVTIYRHLSSLATQSYDVATITELLTERLSAPVCVVSDTLDVMSAAGPSLSPHEAMEYVRKRSTDPRFQRVLRAAAQTKRAIRSPDTESGGSLLVAPIFVGNEVAAYLTILETTEQPGGEDISLLVAEHAATICGIVVGRERVVAAAAGRVRDDLIEGLLLARSHDSRELQRWAHHLGYDPSRAHRVLTVTIDIESSPRGNAPDARHPERRQRVSGVVEHFFKSRVPTAITAVREDEVLVVTPESLLNPDLELNRLGAECIAYARQLFSDACVTVAIGGVCQDPVEIASAYAKARRTAETARRLGRRGQLIAFDELGVHRLLLQVQDLDQLRSFASEVLGELMSYERAHKSELLQTLSVYFHEDGSPQRTAQKLHVHPNTVSYRLKRIEEIGGIDLRVYRERLMAQVALEIAEILDYGHE